MHPFFRRGARPLVFAHRGGSALAPENTVAAFDQGIALGADGLELDVHLSRDGIPVVHHDSTLDRTTDRTGDVASLTADELAHVDAGFRYSRDGAFPFRGESIGIPTLAEVLARYPNSRVIIEMKVNRVDMAEAVITALQRTDAVDRACLGAFSRRVIRAVRERAPAVATSAAYEEVRWALYRSWCRFPLRHAPFQGYQVPELAGQTRVVSQRFVNDAHRAGLGVQVWTVDTEPDAQRLMAWSVDGLITDRPDLIVATVRSAP